MIEKKLKQSIQQFQTLAENSPDIIARFDRHLRYRYVNQTISKFTGLSPDKFIGKTNREVNIPDQLCVQWENAISQVFAKGESVTLESTYPLNNDARRLQSTLIPERDDNREIESVLCVTRDITVQFQAEMTLRRDKDAFEVIMNNTHTQLAYLDRDFRFVMVNDAYVDGSGYSREALLGKCCFDLFPNQENQIIFEKVRDTGKPFSVASKPFEYLDDPKRNITYWDWSLVPVKENDGSVTGLVLSQIDVTNEHKTIQEREKYILQIQRLSIQLKKQTAALESVIASLADPVLVFNHDGKIVKANQAAHHALGKNPVRIRKQEIRENLLIPIDHPSPCPRDKVLIHRLLAGETIQDETYTYQKRKDKIRFGLVSASPIERDGEISGAVVTWHDITERLERQAQLLASEKRYVLAQQLSGIGSWDWDIRTGYVEWSSTTYSLFGIKKRQFDRSYPSFMQMIHPDDRHMISREINACIEEGLPFDAEHRVIWPNGQIHWLRQTGNVIRDENQLAIRMLGMVSDMTERKTAEENQQLLAEIVNESEDAIIVRNLENIITMWNAGAERLYGYPAEKMMGNLINCLLPKEKHSEHLGLLERTQKGEHIRHFETRRIRRDGETIYVAISFSPLRNDKDEVYAVATIEHDITERIKAEKMLRNANEKLEIRVQERTQKLQTTNQELQKEIKQRIHFQEKLRLLTAELVRSEEHQRREIATALHDKIIQMLVFSNIKLDQLAQEVSSKSQISELILIQEYLEETISELRTMTFQISPPVLYELGLIPALEWLAEKFENTHNFECHIEKDSEEKPVSDEIRNMLFQAVNELLNNIAKHAEAKQVWLRVQKDKDQIMIQVEDDGKGFDPNTIKADLENNSGFGLFNIKERIEFLNGHFYLYSEENNGTSVQLIAPLHKE